MRLGVDVGGTFTDLAASRRAHPADLSGQDAVDAGGSVDRRRRGRETHLRQGRRSRPPRYRLILHGTTVATNAVLEGKGARVGLLVTEGFEYTLHLAKAWTPGPLFGWIIMDKPDPLASLADTRGIPERINARGEIVRPLDVAKATR